MKLKTYYRAETIEEVVSLVNKSKKNIILGGTHWLKMNKANYNMGIDISKLGLGDIKETETAIEIGGDVSLRQLETSPVIQQYAGILCEAVSSIVGVQFRNTARLGASVYSRFGFSDVTAALLTLDTEIEVDGDERIPLADYQELPRNAHFVTRIIITKESLKYDYHTMRQNSTSLPYMIVGMTKSSQNQWRISVGARPLKAKLAVKTMEYFNKGGSDINIAVELLIEESGLSNNVYSNQAYREHLAEVFLKRGAKSLWS